MKFYSETVILKTHPKLTPEQKKELDTLYKKLQAEIKKVKEEKKDETRLSP